MSDKVATAIGILLFAVAAAIVYMWGLKKSMNQSGSLLNKLYSNAGNKVVDYLKSNGSISKTQMEDLVDGTVAKQLFSTKKAVVRDKKDFTKQLIEFLTKNNIIITVDEGNKRNYKLK